MTKERKARIILDAIDVHAPTCIDWNLEKLWLNAIACGLEDIQKAEQELKRLGVKETPEAATSRESRK